MHAVARPIDVAAGNALVRLHKVEARPAPRRASGAREGPVAPHLADVEGIDLHYPPRAPAFGFSADQGDFRTRSLERRHGACDKALGAPERIESLTHDGEAQVHAALTRISRAAACTASTGSSVRHSLTLLPPQPSTPHGRHECVVVTMRCSTFHGAHSASFDGPKSAMVGVPIAAARCIGIESTPMKRCARAVSAPSSLSDSPPARLSGLLAVFARIWSMKLLSCGAAVSTTAWPSAARRSASCALR